MDHFSVLAFFDRLLLLLGQLDATKHRSVVAQHIEVYGNPLYELPIQL